MTTIQYSDRISQIRHQTATRRLHLDVEESAALQARRSVADALSREHGLRFEPEDVAFAESPFAALTALVTAVSDPGDAVVVLGGDPFHTSLVSRAAAEATVVGFDRESGSLDLAALARALTRDVRAVILDAQDQVWQSRRAAAELARLLTTASNVFGRPILVIVDETGSRPNGDEPRPADLTSLYPYTFLVGAIPGEAVHVAVPTTMPNRQQWRPAITAAKLVLLSPAVERRQTQPAAPVGRPMSRLVFAS